MTATDSIRELCEVVTSGGTPPRKHPEYFSVGKEGHLWVKSKELKDGPIDDTEEKITEEGLEFSSAKYLPAKTVLIAMYGANVGQLGWLKRPATVNQAVCGMVVNHRIADFRYVFYALLQTRNKLATKALGAAQQNLNQGLISDFEIPTPPLPTQRKIAAILSAYDDLIESNLRRIKILEEMAQALYRQWFVKFRFPGHEKVRMVDSPLGKIPEGWEVTQLRHLADVNRRSIRRPDTPETIRYIDISSVSPGRIEEIRVMAFEDAPSRARRIVQHQDIIWSCVRPNRRSHAIVLHPQPNTIASTGFAVISPREVPFTYLYQAVTTDQFVGYLTNRTRGAAYPAVAASDFEEADILVPPSFLQDRFHEIVEPECLQMDNWLRRNRVLRRTRDLLLPKLISGELDIRDLDIGGYGTGMRSNAEPKTPTGRETPHQRRLTSLAKLTQGVE